MNGQFFRIIRLAASTLAAFMRHEFKRAGAGRLLLAPTSEKKIAALFDRWNDSLESGDPQKVVANYAGDAILLATVSSQPS